MNRLLLIVVIALVATCSNCLAESATDDRIAEIEKAVEEENAKLVEISTKVNNIQSHLEKLKIDLEKLREREKNLGAELERVRKERDRSERELKHLRSGYRKLRLASMDRLRVMYMQRMKGPLSSELFANLSEDSFRKISYYGERVRQHDKQMLINLLRASMRIKKEQNKLKELLSSRDRLQSELELKRKEIAGKIQAQNKAIIGLKKSEEDLKSSITTLRSQALRLETVVSSITEGTDSQFYTRNSTAPTSPSRAEKTSDYKGPGLAAKKSKLVLPLANGDVMKTFGKQKLAGFSEMVFNKGIEFETDSGAAVRAVASGAILYSGRMPGIGSILIVNHGARSYSLYGRLGQMLVEKNQVVAAGQEIARVSTASNQSEGKSGRFYFEVRKNGKPVNPEIYFGKVFK